MFIEVNRVGMGWTKPHLLSLDKIMEIIPMEKGGCQVVLQDWEVLNISDDYNTVKTLLAYLGKYDSEVSKRFLKGDKE